MNSIIREVFVKIRDIPDEIPYTRNTNAQPIQFRFCDFTIPKDARAKVYVQKTSGKAVYDDAVISVADNTVTVNVKTQMFSELGSCSLQLRIEQGEEVLVTFSQPIRVLPNYTEGDAEASKNECGFFEEYEEKINGMLDEANEAASDARAEALKAAGSKTAAAGSATEAAGFANKAANSAAASANSASDSEDYSKLSESHSHGNTGVREGEDTDNSEYYKEQAKLEADRARDEADRAASIVGMDIDSEFSETSTNPVMNKVVAAAIGERLEKNGDSSDTTVSFEQSDNRDNIESGKKTSTLFGKIAKWFSDIANGAGSTLLGANLTQSRVLVSDASGKISVSSITSTILGYLSGLKSNVQDQIDTKVDASKIVESTNITESGFLMGGMTGSKKFGELDDVMNKYENVTIVRPSHTTLGGDILAIDAADKSSNKHRYYGFGQSSSLGYFTNMPSLMANVGFFGFRTVRWQSASWIEVVLNEIYPQPGRIWENAYTNPDGKGAAWKGWHEISATPRQILSATYKGLTIMAFGNSNFAAVKISGTTTEELPISNASVKIAQLPNEAYYPKHSCINYHLAGLVLYQVRILTSGAIELGYGYNIYNKTYADYPVRSMYNYTTYIPGL